MPKKKFEFIQFYSNIKFPDGIYNGLYNKEPAIVRIEGGTPVYVSFIGFLKDGESRSSAIFDARGIMHSNVELLVSAQEIN